MGETLCQKLVLNRKSVSDAAGHECGKVDGRQYADQEDEAFDFHELDSSQYQAPKIARQGRAHFAGHVVQDV